MNRLEKCICQEHVLILIIILLIKTHTKEENWRSYYKNAFKYAKKYWGFERHIIYESNKMFSDMFKNSGNILGVALRENFSNEYYKSI